VGPVEEICVQTEALRALEEADGLQAQPPAPRGAAASRRIGLAIAGVLLAGSLGAAAFWTATSLYRPPPAVQGKRVLAILPFENRSGQSELDWLREGLPDMLATTFSRSKSLDVLSREQVYVHRKRAEDSGVK